MIRNCGSPSFCFFNLNVLLLVTMSSVIRGECCPVGIDIGTQSIYIAEAKESMQKPGVLSTEVLLNRYAQRKTL